MVCLETYMPFRSKDSVNVLHAALTNNTNLKEIFRHPTLGLPQQRVVKKYFFFNY